MGAEVRDGFEAAGCGACWLRWLRVVEKARVVVIDDGRVSCDRWSHWGCDRR